MALASDEFPSPEKRLLVCCARTTIEDSVREEIRRLVRSPLDWDLLFLEASNQAVTPLLCRQLSRIASDLLEPVRLARLKEAGRAFALRNLVLSAELVTIMDRFQSEGLQAIPYKGPVLAIQAYGDMALREFEDLDIVLRQHDMARANELMIGLGYRPKFPAILSTQAAASVAPGEYGYRDDSRHLMVELHTERTLRHFPVPADIADLATRLMAVSVGGHDLKTFSPEDTFLLLCIHGSKHFWAQLSWVADLAAFVEAYPQLDWEEILGRAQSMRANRMVSISLALALRLFNPPHEIARRIGSDSVASSLASEIERRLLARSPRELGAIARFRLRRHMLERFWEGWRYSLRLATQPSDDDWSTMPLPPRLAPLYRALRPLRLLSKYGATSSRGSMASKNASN